MRVGVVSFGFAQLFIDMLYSLPGLVAFHNPVPMRRKPPPRRLGLAW